MDSNHSLRVTAATRLFQSGTDEQLIMDRTGHRSIDGIRAYKRISQDQEKEVSSVLNKEECERKAALMKIRKTVMSHHQAKKGQLQIPNCSNITINY